jgi:hypothetical protein
MKKVFLTVVMMFTLSIINAQVSGERIYRNGGLMEVTKYSDNTVSLTFSSLRDLEASAQCTIDFESIEEAKLFFNSALKVIEDKVNIKLNGVQLKRIMGKTQVTQNGEYFFLSKSSINNILKVL